MNIIGISAFYHDSACCIIKDGSLIAAVQEERFSRIKNDSSLPVKSLKFCLDKANLSIADVDYIAYYENPVKKLSRQLCCGINYFDSELRLKLNPNRPENEIKNLLGFEGEIKFIDHHMSHAASSFLFSGFSNSAILTCDGVGEWATTTYGFGKDNDITLFEEVQFPNSLGLLYSTITNYLGFRVNSGEYKIMGLAPYGSPKYKDKLFQLIKNGENGQYSLELKYFDFLNERVMYSENLIKLLGHPPRHPESKLLRFHMDVAKSLQVVLEEILLSKANYLFSKTGETNLCLAGGVALNCVANGRILREGPFKKIFVQPAANDAGCALGAAAKVFCEITKQKLKSSPLRKVFLGPEYSNKEIKKLLDATSLKVKYFPENSNKLLKETAKRLTEGKVIGWFQGRLEFGPRALGGRSIIADPRNSEMRDRINKMVKKRESFRPFAPSVLENKTRKHFDLNHSSPFMLETCQVVSSLSLPAITHIDGSARVQTVNVKDNPKFGKLLVEFEKLTGCPILLNTSFNVRGEPIVCSPSDALKCFITSDLDCLVIGNCIIDRNDNAMNILENSLSSTNSSKLGFLNPNVYSFI